MNAASVGKHQQIVARRIRQPDTGLIASASAVIVLNHPSIANAPTSGRPPFTVVKRHAAGVLFPQATVVHESQVGPNPSSAQVQNRSAELIAIAAESVFCLSRSHSRGILGSEARIADRVVRCSGGSREGIAARSVNLVVNEIETSGTELLRRSYSSQGRSRR